ncbi:FHA domain-containing protein [Ilumatobacter sp.]|uniref:FHA domain-containing protein n=1 Tax=Ilumatobacter sp. TaxID=1967498 RepID=UPI003753476E
MSTSTSDKPSEQIVEIIGRGIGAASEVIATVGQRRGYTVGAVGPGSFRLERSTRPVWATGLAIITMPIFGLGLVFLRMRTRESAMVTVFEDRTGVKARVVGVVDAALLEQLTSVVQPGPRPAPATAHSASTSASPGSGAQRTAPSPITAMPGSADLSSGVIPARQTPSAPPLPSPPPQFATSQAAGGTDVDRTMARPAQSASASSMPPPMVVAQAQAQALRLRLRLPDGSERIVTGPMVIGRQPAPNGGELVVVISDPSLSKSHVRVEPAGAGLLVTDLQSTNGSSIRSSRGVHQCAPGISHPIGINEVLVAGEVEISVGATQ